MNRVLVHIGMGQIDAAGILFFAEVFPLAHQAYERFVCEELRIPWNEWFANPRWVVPIRHAQADYRLPIPGGIEIFLDIHVAEIRTHTFILQTAFVLGEQKACVVDTVHIFCDRQSGRKVPIPLEICSLLRMRQFQPQGESTPEEQADS